MSRLRQSQSVTITCISVTPYSALAFTLLPQIWRLISPTSWLSCPCRPQLHMWLVLVEGRSLTNSYSNWLMKILYRRASGFTTRSDIGPAREGPSAEVIAYVNVLLLIYPLFLFIIFLAKLRKGEEKKSQSILSNFKIQTTNTVYLLVPPMSRTTKKQTRYTIQ